MNQTQQGINSAVVLLVVIGSCDLLDMVVYSDTHNKPRMAIMMADLSIYCTYLSPADKHSKWLVVIGAWRRHEYEVS